MSAVQSPQQNHLLAALPAAEFEWAAARLQLVPLRLGEILYEPGLQLHSAYFPTSSTVSLHYVTESGKSAEIAGVGREGMVGVSLFMGGETASGSATVQTAGHAYRLSADLLSDAFERSVTVQDLLLCYTNTLITQISQNATCSRYHSVKHQLCRWLLLNLDRTPADEFVMTQELIASILGLPPERIREVSLELQSAGFIRYRRSHIAVLDRRGLEAHACECYAVGKREYRRVLPVGALKTESEMLRTKASRAPGVACD